MNIHLLRLAASVLFVIAYACGSAGAAPVIVRNTNDNLTGSLRQAISDAHPGDTIVFEISVTDPHYDSATGVFTITLTQASAAKYMPCRDLACSPRGLNFLTSRSASSPGTLVTH